MAMLEIRDLNVYYGGIHALKGISLEVEEGQIVSMIGSNGAGKSSMMNAISGLVKYKSGEILYKGQPLPTAANKVMSAPDLIMLDEPSLGLAPLLVNTIFDTIREIKAMGKTILLVEQNALKALSVADNAYVLEQGRITKSGPGKELLKDPAIAEAYLGKAAR